MMSICLCHNEFLKYEALLQFYKSTVSFYLRIFLHGILVYCFSSYNSFSLRLKGQGHYGTPSSMKNIIQESIPVGCVSPLRWLPLDVRTGVVPSGDEYSPGTRHTHPTPTPKGAWDQTHTYTPSVDRYKPSVDR